MDRLRLFRPEAGQFDLFVMRPDGTDVRQVTTDPTKEANPVPRQLLGNHSLTLDNTYTRPTSASRRPGSPRSPRSQRAPACRLRPGPPLPRSSPAGPRLRSDVGDAARLRHGDSGRRRQVARLSTCTDPASLRPATSPRLTPTIRLSPSPAASTPRLVASRSAGVSPLMEIRSLGGVDRSISFGQFSRPTSTYVTPARSLPRRRRQVSAHRQVLRLVPGEVAGRPVRNRACPAPAPRRS